MFKLNPKTLQLLALIAIILIAGGITIYYQRDNIQKTFFQSTPTLEEKKTALDLNSFEDYYNTAKDSAKTEAQETKTEIDFFAVGDIMLSRNVANQIQKNSKDSFWPFRKLENELLSTDFNFGNLESPFSGSDNFPNTESLIFNAPTWVMPGLVQYNFKVLNLANNHGLDQGKDGIKFTKDLLKRNGSVSVGAGENLDEAWRGEVFSVKGVRVGFIGVSYASSNDGGSGRNNYIARIEDETRLKKSIAELKTRADFIVVTMHAGEEYTRDPNPAQTKFAKTAVDAGADMVIGAHPHWIQTFEKYQDKYIFYSLGNFVFDQMWSQDTKEGMMLKVSLEKAGSCAKDVRASPSGQQEVVCSDALQGSNYPTQLKSVELVPVIIEHFGQPRLASESEASAILKKIGATQKILE